MNCYTLHKAKFTWTRKFLVAVIFDQSASFLVPFVSRPFLVDVNRDLTISQQRFVQILMIKFLILHADKQAYKMSIIK